MSEYAIDEVFNLRRPARPAPGASPPRVAGLTARELEVLGLLAQGWSNKEMAQHLSISAKTVGKHLEHIYLKIGTSTRCAAAMFAMRHGLVDGLGA